MGQKKQALKLPSVNRVMSVFSLAPNFLFFWIVHLPSHWTVSSDNSLHIFTTHFFEIYSDFFPDNSICQLKCCVQFLFFPYTFCALPQLLLFSLYCLGTGSQAGMLIILLSGVSFSTAPVQCPSSWAMAREGGQL
jgi:hypothetical protein